MEVTWGKTFMPVEKNSDWIFLNCDLQLNFVFTLKLKLRKPVVLQTFLPCFENQSARIMFGIHDTWRMRCHLIRLVRLTGQISTTNATPPLSCPMLALWGLIPAMMVPNLKLLFLKRFQCTNSTNAVFKSFFLWSLRYPRVPSVSPRSYSSMTGPHCQVT